MIPLIFTRVRNKNNTILNVEKRLEKQNTVHVVLVNILVFRQCLQL